MTDAIGPTGSSREKYEQEYKQGADLFQKALTQYNKSSNPYQQAEFKSVMDQAMHVMNETAHALMRQELEKQTQKIAKDYATFQKYPSDPDTISKLNRDLDRAKKSVG